MEGAVCRHCPRVDQVRVETRGRQMKVQLGLGFAPMTEGEERWEELLAEGANLMSKGRGGGLERASFLFSPFCAIEFFNPCRRHSCRVGCLSSPPLLPSPALTEHPSAC